MFSGVCGDVDCGGGRVGAFAGVGDSSVGGKKNGNDVTTGGRGFGAVGNVVVCGSDSGSDGDDEGAVVDCGGGGGVDTLGGVEIESPGAVEVSEPPDSAELLHKQCVASCPSFMFEKSNSYRVYSTQPESRPDVHSYLTYYCFLF